MKYLLIISLFLLSFAMHSQILVDKSLSPEQLVRQILVGDGIEVSNVVFQGAIGNVQSIAAFDSYNSNVGIDEGVMLSTGRVLNAAGPNDDDGFDNSEIIGLPSDPDLNGLSGSHSESQDAIILEFDFVPVTDSISFNYVFASEEYREFVNEPYNDVFGFFLSGPGINGPFSNNAINIARVPGSSDAVAINSVNHLRNSNYFRDNGTGSDNAPQYYDWSVVQYDGLTTRLQAIARVTPCETYHIKIAIQDVADGIYDSAVFLERGSFSVHRPIANAGPDQDLCNGESIPIGYFPIRDQEYAWSPATGLSSTTVANPIVSLQNNGNNPITVTYTLSVTVDGCTNFEEYQDEVVVTVQPDLELDAGLDVELCTGDTIQIGEPARDHYYYEWQTIEGITDVNSSLTDLSLINEGGSPLTFTYSIQAWDTLTGCSNQDDLEVVVNPEAQITASEDIFVCQGFDGGLGASGGVSYEWSPNLFIDNRFLEHPTVNPSGSITYFVLGIDENGCEGQDSVQVIVDGKIPTEAGEQADICLNDSLVLGGDPTSFENVDFLWRSSNLLNDHELANPTAYPLDSTWFYVETVSDTCSGRDSVFVGVWDLPEVETDSSLFFCLLDTLELIASGAEDYDWQSEEVIIRTEDSSAWVSPVEDAFYFVIGTDENGCQNKDSVLVTPWDLPIITPFPDTNICHHDTIQLFTNPQFSYLWEANGYLANDTLQQTAYSTSVSELVYLSVQDSNACKNRDTIAVTVFDRMDLVTTPDTALCYGSELWLRVSGGNRYQWMENETLLDSKGDSVLTNTLVPNEFFVVAYDVNNCRDTASINVTINPQPIASFNNQYELTCDGIAYGFENTSTEYLDVLWTSSMGEVSELNTFESVFPYGVPNSVQLIATNNHCKDTADFVGQRLDLIDASEVEYGDILTLNGDDINACFKVDIHPAFETCHEVQIFSRWGEPVFRSSEFDWCWEGINEYTNQPVSSGTYFFIISVAGEILHKGTFTVLH